MMYGCKDEWIMKIPFHLNGGDQGSWFTWLGLVLEKVIGSDISTYFKTVHANDKISTSFSGQ